MQIEMSPQDQLIKPTIGEGGYSRDAAHAEIQKAVDRHAPHLSGTWRAGAKDDTVFKFPFTWVIYEHEPGQPVEAAHAWCEDYAATMRTTGLDVQVARLPDS